MSNEQYYTLQQVATLLQVSERTIMRLIKTRRLPAVRVGRQYRIAKSDLQDYLRSSGQSKSDDQQTPSPDEQT